MPAEILPNTLGAMSAEVIDWLAGEKVPDSRIRNAINDSIEDLWGSLIIFCLEIMTGGPVTININAGDEREKIISINDPTISPTAVDLSGASTLPAENFQIAYTYVTESGSETLMSPLLSYSRGLNNLAQVSAPVTVISGAFGWNLYVGNTTANLCRQNDTPIPILQSGVPPANQTFDEPATGFISYPDGPLPPTENTTGDNIFNIGHLEFKTSSGLYKAYNRGSLDSDFMRRLATYIAATSEYQTYGWDLINQRQLEIRPAAGQSFSPRYFYVAKPRRLLFDNASLPFPNIPQTQYIRASALSAIFLTLHEYDASTAWENKAGAALMKAQRALTAMNYNVNDRVTPYMY